MRNLPLPGAARFAGGCRGGSGQDGSAQGEGGKEQGQHCLEGELQGGKGGLGMTKAAKHSPAVCVSTTSRSAPSPARLAQPGQSCGVSDHRESLLPLPDPGLLGHLVFKGHSQRTLQ